jgi:exodeoxyribonuclease-5
MGVTVTTEPTPPSEIIQFDDPVLTDEQQVACDALVNYVVAHRSNKGRGMPPFRTLGGLAGTGKTTVIKEIVRELDDRGLDAEVSAFTGKACSVLRKKRVTGAKTLHSLMYICETDEKTHQVVYTRKHSLDCDFIIIDEASMVSRELYEDLLSFHKPVIFVGDYGQLDPIGDNPKLMQNFDLRLEKIHRQAEQNPIIRFARDLRRGVQWPYGEYLNADGQGVIIVPRERNITNYIQESDQLIVATNATRKKYNGVARALNGFSGPTAIGEKLACLKNDRIFGVFNGLTLWVERIERPARSAYPFYSFKDELDNKFYSVPVYEELLAQDNDFTTYQKRLAERREALPRSVTFFNYGYAITCHKSQGSEYDMVTVCDQYIPVFDMNKWRYTAATRAARRLVWVR